MLVSGSAEAASAGNLDLEHVETDFDDKESLQRGFRTYMNYCASCHELGYARYERTADDLGIPHDLVLANLVFDDSLIGDLIENAMSEDDAKSWFGAAPPDLTLAGRVHSPDWLYTYLKSFYNDPSRPLGANNKIYAMSVCQMCCMSCRVMLNAMITEAGIRLIVNCIALKARAL